MVSGARSMLSSKVAASNGHMNAPLPSIQATPSTPCRPIEILTPFFTERLVELPNQCHVQAQSRHACLQYHNH
ncbi:hypothetical protein OF83DRAFT_532441 [Amylostereum chailletii]|nr:hypothetical protein OF83DRAFT_532441 [Amylostereum chailletii]